MNAVSPPTVLWFGTGSMTAEILPAVDRKKLNILAFIDERPERRGTIFAGAPVIGLDEIPRYSFDLLLVAARPFAIIADKLQRAGVPEEKTLSMDFENLPARTGGLNAEEYIDAMSGHYPGLGEAFTVSRLLRSTWFADAVGFLSGRNNQYDDRFFTGSRFPGVQTTFLPDRLARPPDLPAMPRDCRSMQIETSALCAYRCFCCASHKARRAKGVMSMEDVRLLARRMGPYSGKAALHHGGEPLLDARLPEKVAALRQAWPQAELSFTSTLGVPVEGKWLDSLWENGISEIEVSFYGYDRATYKNIHGVDGFALAGKNLSRLLDSPAREISGGLVTVRMLHLEENGRVEPEKYVEQAADFRNKVLARNGVRAIDTWLSSHSGQGPIQRRRATVLPCGIAWGLFRDRINVTWDMNVVPCCQDYDNHIVFGNLRRESVEEIFSGAVYRDFIRAHWSGDLSAWPLCRECERSVSGTREQLMRVSVWKIAHFLSASPKGEKTSFAVIGEESLAGPVADFFLRNFPACRRVALDGADLPAELDHVFIIARNRAQLVYYQQVQGREDGRGLPVLGVGYHVETSLAAELAGIYGNPRLAGAWT